MAQQISAKAKKPVLLGSYADYALSLHIYGQDFKQVGGDAQRGLASFFDTFTEESSLERSLSSEDAKEMLVLPQLRELLSDRLIEQWKFPESSFATIQDLIAGLESGKYKA